MKLRGCIKSSCRREILINAYNKTNEQNRIRGIESWNRLKIVRGMGEGRDSVKEGEGIRQRTYMKDPCTWTTVWGLSMGVGGRMGRREQRGKNRDNSNSANNFLKGRSQINN